MTEIWLPLRQRLHIVPLVGTQCECAASGGYINDDPDAAGIGQLDNIELLTPELTMAVGAERRAAESDNVARRDGSFFYLYLLYLYIAFLRGAGRAMIVSKSILMLHQVKVPSVAFLEVIVDSYRFNYVNAVFVSRCILSIICVPMAVIATIGQALPDALKHVHVEALMRKSFTLYRIFTWRSGFCE
ncbi:hypothetical protein L861_02350 [Litchfieldella anticariensis FP35 = DSM 16096]|uniref:Uncharacterized protein n=1 Tax=Litchfieldella anticariensis (strain DSM 16096 / CECT 5854 / CIP 108499 / LMG 22089 / FP35) TaxID=1121939 RepID=S2KUC0_LITA3|nr:hypothetical protein [Halomonas anticariensis]EPC04173.1 hypothetical protein L861_02350 [Halomonas anticariensis FP35 = DSM 16096]